jgi:hypothetical protein
LINVTQSETAEKSLFKRWFLTPAVRIFQNLVIFTFQSLFQVICTSFFGLTLALSALFIPVYPAAGDSR